MLVHFSLKIAVVFRLRNQILLEQMKALLCETKR